MSKGSSLLQIAVLKIYETNSNIQIRNTVIIYEEKKNNYAKMKLNIWHLLKNFKKNICESSDLLNPVGLQFIRLVKKNFL